jgi:hypothetical protein
VEGPLVGAASLRRARLGQRLVGADGHIAVELWVEALDALEVGLDELDGRYLPGANQLGLLRRREEREVCVHRGPSITRAQ